MSFGRGFWSVRVFGGWSIFEGCLDVLCFCGLQHGGACLVVTWLVGDKIGMIGNDYI